MPTPASHLSSLTAECPSLTDSSTHPCTSHLYIYTHPVSVSMRPPMHPVSVSTRPPMHPVSMQHSIHSPITRPPTYPSMHAHSNLHPFPICWFSTFLAATTHPSSLPPSLPATHSSLHPPTHQCMQPGTADSHAAPAPVLRGYGETGRLFPAPVGVSGWRRHRTTWCSVRAPREASAGDQVVLPGPPRCQWSRTHCWLSNG